MAAKTYDAIVVGSGITGGWAAKELGEKGLETLVLEAGRPIDPDKDYAEHVPEWEVRYRGMSDRRRVQENQSVQETCSGMDEWNSKFFVNDKQNPYKTEPGKPFLWIRGRQVGGRSIIWGRQSYRWSDLDFEANQREGVGVDWPIRYKEIAPWYDYVEDFIGVSGQREGLPQLPDGHFLPGMELNCAEVVVKDAIAKYFPGRASHDHRAHRDPDPAAQGPRALPLLRAVRPRLHHPLLLQQPELDFARCADHRQSDGTSAQRGAQPDVRFQDEENHRRAGDRRSDA